MLDLDEIREIHAKNIDNYADKISAFEQESAKKRSNIREKPIAISAFVCGKCGRVTGRCICKQFNLPQDFIVFEPAEKENIVNISAKLNGEKSKNQQGVKHSVASRKRNAVKIVQAEMLEMAEKTSTPLDDKIAISTENIAQNMGAETLASPIDVSRFVQNSVIKQINKVDDGSEEFDEIW